MRKRGVLIFAVISLVLLADTASEKTRARAWDALKSNVKHEGVLNHSLAVEAIMREMARTKPENDADQWALAGLSFQGMTMGVIGNKFVGYVAFDSVNDANRGAAILSDLSTASA